jgi:hypothetical protein
MAAINANPEWFFRPDASREAAVPLLSIQISLGRLNNAVSCFRQSGDDADGNQVSHRHMSPGRATGLTEQRTTSITLENSTSVPPPVVMTMRP